MPSNERLVHVTNLTKRYGRLTALSDVSFSVYAGEVLGLLGPNGSGKTTLFECLGGVLPVDSGTVQGSSPFYLPDGVIPWPSQTVAWALDFTLGFFGGPVNKRDQVVRNLDIAPLLSTRMGALSKGERKRALLAIGLLTPQPILMADEPFDGLDLRQSRDVARTLRSAAATGRTMFLSIHQISDAARVCDRFVLLSGGRVRGEGTFDELRQRVAHDATMPRDIDMETLFLALT